MSQLQDLLRGTSLPPARRQAQGLAIFTICSNNYLSLARILIASAQEFHPDATVYLCLADALLPDEGFYPQGCVVVPVEDLDIPDFASFVFRYDIMELNTAAKPFMFQYLLRAGHDTVLYFDPDIEVFGRLEQVLTPLRDGASFVLTPHLCAPSEGEAFPDDIGIMRAGIYNLGFLGVHASEETSRILAWWARRLQYQCVSDQDRGLFVDQKFMDLVPGFADRACILRDTTLNVAYWNLPQRELTQDGESWRVDGQPLGFYHFSGFDVANMHRLSKHAEGFRDAAIFPALARLMEHYAARVHAARHGTVSPGLYAFGRFASGTRIPALARKMFRDRHISWSADPFQTYETYLNAPLPGQWAGSSSAIVTNLMGYLHSQQPWLHQHFHLATEAGVRHFVDWFVHHGELYVEQTGLTAKVADRLGAASDQALRRPPAKRSAEEADIDVIGYLKLATGVGEVGRLNLRSLAAGGLRARGLETSLNSPAPRIDSSCDPLLEPEAQARFQLFSINCDQLPQVMEHLRPRLRADAYRIAAPFWELSMLPEAWAPALDLADELWAPTRFIQATLVKKTRKPVLWMPPLLDFTPPGSPPGRSHFNLPDRAFLFFFAFDYLSFMDRKNPMAVIAAFKRAFRAEHGDHSVRLVLKTLNGAHVPEAAAAMRDAIQADPDIVLIDRTLARDETLGLIACCDAVVTLHRSEGLGLLVAEAMVLGKPVVATDYSGTTDLVTPATGWPVDFRMVPVRAGQYPFHEHQSWAEVDVGHAAWQMRRVVNDRPEAARRAAAAREMIAREYGMAAVAGRQRARLQQLEG